MSRQPVRSGHAPVRKRVLSLGVLPVLALVLAVLPGCAAGGSTTDGGIIAGDKPGGAITVFAAASLKQAFTDLSRTFEAEHPGTTVTLSFAGSSDLAGQISQGAPADVFASADMTNMKKVQDAGLTDGAPEEFATNTLAIAVPPGNPAGIASLQDLARPGIKLVTCARQVPCGAAAATAAQAAGLALSPVSEENAVTDVLGKVTSGEADAGLVYGTDIKAAGTKVAGIRFPESGSAVNTYPIAGIAGSRNQATAQAFMDLVTGPEGQKVLGAAGFGPAGSGPSPSAQAPSATAASASTPSAPADSGPGSR
ncbi:molybdate ABC transporter substrate-binding protein [Pseudarthrobacter sp. C4D7]|uniref:molybdate ABC transporter substrate-binding protein n=1 Tax=Pseudarthrobacter sp. C4D7 TaxID=2735268 RepID=UPI0015854929|nr:molybdate ABC transporter substrate-binding protein [Pseudarthrobacter sp. C4D7]NUT70264.1 molybdate ABC transporter substrate-binding protein [Pseudarthrobacter sp. C4D7]